ncbi:ribbon-helix-helix protein, CopG family [Candidatus Bathyarchaeota archaeon]|nr:MAG: ribbon-helix-helix protein, CopG family [Candidatus Bathyarchaeota archaeon]RLI15699.1 MAG: nickel-responsive regulator 1 [Candidatus Bathyarchaeota archaeon]
MPRIISVSLSENLLEEVSRIQREMGFSGRSEVIRAGLRRLIAEHRKLERMRGRINSILLVVHEREDEDIVNRIKHEFDDIINTQLHSHLKRNKCLEIFILDGDAERTREIVECFETCGKMEYVNLIVP